MRDWKKVKETNTLGEQMDVINHNSDNGKFLDTTTSHIMSNGYVFTGKETVCGQFVLPLTNVNLEGVVPSAVVFDNFKLFFRNTGNIIELDRFPVDLLSYKTGKPQFLYFREDFSYRVSEYMYGQTDEVLLARFIINRDGTWNQFYVMPQRASAPLFHAGDEFYELEGLYVKSPGGLNLSTTEGTVKRSGIEFTDTVSPDVYHSYRLENQKVPIRYITTANEVDYTREPGFNIITDKVMEYNQSSKIKVNAEELIRGIINLYYGIEKYSTERADELHTAITLGASLEDKQSICNVFVERVEHIYEQVNSLLDILMDDSLASVDKTKLAKNIDDMNTFLNSRLRGGAIAINITESQVIAMRQVPSYIKQGDTTVCNYPLEDILQDVIDDLNEIVYPVGTLTSVPAGKFTVQRILWDVYEDCFIIQYGNQIYDTFNEAAEGTGRLDFPAPYGKTIYIPTAVMIIKSGITDLNNDADSIIITRRWIYVDSSFDVNTDIIARTRADKALKQIQDIIGGVTPVGKADSLKYTENGRVQYADGDYYLNYNNLRNKLININDLNHGNFSAFEVLSAYQGYLLNQNKLNRDGAQDMTGTLSAQSVNPKLNNTYSLGTKDYAWNSAYIKNLYTSGNLYFTDSNGNNRPYIYSGDSTVLDIRAMAKSSYNSSTAPRGSLVFCW